MIWQINSYQYDQARREEMLAWVETIKPAVQGIGALTAQVIDFGDGRGANLVCFPTAEAAEAGVEKAKALYQAAEQMGFLLPGSLEMRRGEMVLDYLA